MALRAGRQLHRRAKAEALRLSAEAILSSQLVELDLPPLLDDTVDGVDQPALVVLEAQVDDVLVDASRVEVLPRSNIGQL